jgi:hypothetical protein
MNETGPGDPSFEPVVQWVSPSRIERIKPTILWLAPLLPVLALVLVAWPFTEWRSIPALLHSTDLRALPPGLQPELEPLISTVPRWVLTAAGAAGIGALTWMWRGRTPGFGFFAALAAFLLSFAVEIVRWFKPGQLPDFRDPLIAAIVAPTVWRLSRYWPDQPVTPLPRFGAWRMRWRILLRFTAAGIGLAIVAAAALVAPAIELMGDAPSQIADHIRAWPVGRSGATGFVTGTISGTLEQLGVVRWLKTVNAIDRSRDAPLPNWVGAGEAHDGILPMGQLRSVATVEALRQAIDTANPGDVILLQPGTYPVRGPYIIFRRGGTAAAPITLRAPRLGLVTLESELPEALKVQAPHWRFENIVLRGVCPDDSTCDNGFHIVGEAEDTILRNLRIEDFNAQIKINGEGGRFPDRGRVEHTTLIDTHGRQTNLPVTPIDLVGANGWVIEDTLIADFVKLSGNTVSYGAFAKGDARGTVFNRDVVLCEWRLRGEHGQTIGLSFGGGGTGNDTRRDGGRSGYEHADGVMQNNLIAFCSDDGIYLNHAANSVLRHNTLLGTSGIDVRFVESTARIEANLLDGPIRARDDGLFWGGGNEADTLLGMFMGREAARGAFANPARLDLRWSRIPALANPGDGTDLCGVAWAEPSPVGAFQDFRACGETRPLAGNGEKQ